MTDTPSPAVRAALALREIRVLRRRFEDRDRAWQTSRRYCYSERDRQWARDDARRADEAAKTLRLAVEAWRAEFPWLVRCTARYLLGKGRRDV